MERYVNGHGSFCPYREARQRGRRSERRKERRSEEEKG